MSENSNQPAFPVEIEITKLIHSRLKREDCLGEEDRETVAYRIAEIMVKSKELYTKVLPRLTNVNGESQAPMDDDLTNLRTNFQNLCDLMQDFDSAFFKSMNHPDHAYNADGEQLDEDEDEEEAAEIDLLNILNPTKPLEEI